MDHLDRIKINLLFVFLREENNYETVVIWYVFQVLVFCKIKFVTG